MLINGGDQDDSPEAGSEGMLGHFSATRSWPPWITPMSRACSTAAARKTPSKCFDALQAPPGESVHRLPCARESAVSIRSQHRHRENPLTPDDPQLAQLIQSSRHRRRENPATSDTAANISVFQSAPSVDAGRIN